MFLSYEYIKDLGFDPKTKKYRYEYRIVDTDFEEVAVAVGAGVDAMVVDVVIETYRKRNLPVVPNLILYWQYYSKKYGNIIEEIIGHSRKHNPYFVEYEDEINKYLLLL